MTGEAVDTAATGDGVDNLQVAHPAPRRLNCALRGRFVPPTVHRA